jgi:hypothetical protein
LIILNVSNSVTPKINGFIKSSVAYGLQSNTFNSETVVENSPKPKTKTFSVIFNQVKQKIDVFFKFFLGQKFFFSSGTIFGTIFSSKSFLTATSRLFINKNIKSFCYKTAPGVFNTVGGFLVISGGGGKWQI